MKVSVYNKKYFYIALFMNVALAVFELLGFLVGLNNFSWRLLRNYTQDSNYLSFFISVIFIFFLIKKIKSPDNKIPLWIKVLRYLSACCLTVTFLVVLFILAPSKGDGGFRKMFFEGSLLYFHLLCPIVSFVSFAFFEKEPKLPRCSVLIAMIPTFVYAVILLILNIAKLTVGPYIFLHVYEQPVYMSIVWIILILGGNALIAFGVEKINNKLSEKN